MFTSKPKQTFNSLKKPVNPIRDAILKSLEKEGSIANAVYKSSEPELGLKDIIIPASSELHAYVILLDFLNENLKQCNPFDYYDFITFDPDTNQVQTVVYYGDPQWRKSYYWKEDNDTLWIKREIQKESTLHLVL